MKRGLFFSLVVLLWGLSGFAQAPTEAKASARPLEVTAGQNITVSITVDKADPALNSYINVTLESKDSKDEPKTLNFNIGLRDSHSLVYEGSQQTPPTSKGVWYVKEAAFYLAASGTKYPLQIDKNPEFTIKPAKTSVPTSGKISISVP